jgi:hypothetical protein
MVFHRLIQEFVLMSLHKLNGFLTSSSLSWRRQLKPA